MTPELTVDSPGEAPKQIPSTAGMTTKVVKGSIWTLAGQVAPLGVSLFTTPLVIRMLGAESYGVLVLVALIPGYLGFADFGMSMASTKFASEAYAEGDLEKEARIIRTAALIALCSSLPFAAVLFALSGWLATLFNVPEYLLSEASLALKIASVTFVVNFLNGIFNTPQLTRLRMDLNTIVNSGFRILGLIATPVVLYLGFGVVGAVTVLLAASLLTFAGHIYLSGRLLPFLFDTTLERPTASVMFKFGGALAVSTIASVLLVNLEKGILSATVSVAALAYYSVATTLATMLTMFTSSMTQSLFPAFSRLQSEADRDHLQSLFSRGVRMNLIWAVPALVFLALIAKPFFTLWAGEDFGRESVVPFYILLLGLAFNILAYLPGSAIMASGRAEVFLKLYWIELVPYAMMAWFLTVQFGIVGAAIAWSARVTADAAALFYFARKTTGVSVPISRLRWVPLAAVVMVAPLALSIYLGQSSPLVLLLAIACAIGYLIAVWRFVLERDEIEWLSQTVRRYV